MVEDLKTELECLNYGLKLLKEKKQAKLERYNKKFLKERYSRSFRLQKCAAERAIIGVNDRIKRMTERIARLAQKIERWEKR